MLQLALVVIGGIAVGGDAALAVGGITVGAYALFHFAASAAAIVVFSAVHQR